MDQTEIRQIVRTKESRSVAQADLRRVRRARERRDRAEKELYDAMVTAHLAGETYRDIAAWAGLSHQRVHEIVRERSDHLAPGRQGDQDDE